MIALCFLHSMAYVISYHAQFLLAILLFNETNNKVKIKPTVICQREIISFLFLQRWIFTNAIAMYFQDIHTPRSQFKRRNKFGLTRHKDIPH